MFFKRKPTEVIPTALQMAQQELFAAIENRKRVLVNFDNAEPEYFEIANNELTAANLAVDMCMRKLKLLQQTAQCWNWQTGRSQTPLRKRVGSSPT